MCIACESEDKKPQIETVLHVNLSLFAYLPFWNGEKAKMRIFTSVSCFLANGMADFSKESMTETDISTYNIEWVTLCILYCVYYYIVNRAISR